MWSKLTNRNIVLLLFLVLCRVDAKVHQCYVCGPGAPLPCDKFDPTDKAFVQSCPSAKGCSLQTHGNSVERSCTDIGIQDCKTANNVQYCYCSESLCNGKTIHFSDDEDLEEGSGTTVIIEKKSNVTSQSNNVQFSFYIFTSILIMCY